MRLTILSLSIFALTTSLSAQHPVTATGPPAGTPSPTESGPTGPITLDVVVSGKQGKHEVPSAGLTRQDFVLMDDKAARPVDSFHFEGASQAQTPVQVTFIVDAVNINYSLLSNARQQLSSFLRREGGHLAQPTRLGILTDQGIQLEAAFTRDGGSLAASLDAQEIGLRKIRRSSGFWGADERTELCLDALTRLVVSERSKPGRKFVIFISPGWPLLSGPAVELSSKQQQRLYDEIVTLNTQMRQARITLYGVNPIGASEDVGRTFYYKDFVKGASKPSQADLGHLSLQVLAEQSGGLVLNGSNDIGQMLQTAVGDASAFYELTFTAPPAKHPNEYHRIDLRLNKPGYTVRTLQGYYGQP